MTAVYTTQLRGHPWDLWGLSQIFDGTGPDATRIETAKPEGRPIYDYKTEAGRLRYARLGFDVYAKMTSDRLVFPNSVPFDEAKAVARDVLRYINGTGTLIDPDFLPVSLYQIGYTTRGRSGAADFGRMTHNKEATFLGMHPGHKVLGSIIAKQNDGNSAVRFVLDAFVLPTSWASLYLVYDTITHDVGGQRTIEAKGWVSAQQCSDFRYSANTSREIREGARHGGAVSPPKPLLSLSQGRDIIEDITRGWLRSL